MPGQYENTGFIRRLMGLDREIYEREDKRCDCCKTEMKEPTFRTRWEYLKGDVPYGVLWICDKCWRLVELDESVMAPWSRSTWVEPRGRPGPRDERKYKEECDKMVRIRPLQKPF